LIVQSASAEYSNQRTINRLLYSLNIRLTWVSHLGEVYSLDVGDAALQQGDCRPLLVSG
jgi:hypothetical protein